MFTSLYDEFTQDNTHRILLESAGLRLRYDKNVLVCFSGSQCSMSCYCYFLYYDLVFNI